MADKTQIMKEAQKYLAKGQVDKAIAEWEKLVHESPDGNTYNIVGDLYFKKGDRKTAVESFHKAANFFRHEGFSLKALALYKKVLNINPADAESLCALGELSEEKGLSTDATRYYLAAADSLTKAGKKDRLLEIYQKILSLSPSNVNLRQKVAEIFLKEGLISDAAAEFVNMAGSYEESGETEKAEAQYRRVLDIQPSNRAAIMGLGSLFERAGEKEKAMRHMKGAVERFPDDTDILFRHAEICNAAGDDAAAKESLYRIVEIDPGNLKPRRLLGEMYLKEGAQDKAWVEYLPVIDRIIAAEKYEEAVSLLKPFKSAEPLETGRRLVSLYRQLGETPLVTSELAELGDALRERGMDDDALACYRDALLLSPDDDLLKERVAELAKKPEAAEEAGKEAVTVRIPGGEKTADEILTEADIFARYGLMPEALRLLESLKVREPHNIDVHAKLKSIHIELSDKESAVTECLILHELYKRSNDTVNSEAILKEAYELYPEDPRLTERGYRPAPDTGVQPVPQSGEAVEVGGAKIEDYEEEIAEADFYARQGLVMEAEKILKKLSDLFPGNTDITERLQNLGQMGEAQESAGLFEQATPEQGKAPGPSAPAEGVEEVPAGPSGGAEFEDLMPVEEEPVDAQQMPEPSLDSDVLEIFQEFKKGLEKELGEEDSETHYNLGIAYKEMGLLDDAITEFQQARGDPKRLVQSSTMLGVCYMEKGLYPLAIETLNRVLKEMNDKEEAYWAVKYELAEAHEKNNELKEALALFTDVYGWDAKFRNVSEKVSRVKAQIGGQSEKDKPKGKKDRVSYL
jgi:tetratricopeptide (TPR) repeat protein